MPLLGLLFWLFHLENLFHFLFVQLSQPLFKIFFETFTLQSPIIFSQFQIFLWFFIFNYWSLQSNFINEYFQLYHQFWNYLSEYSLMLDFYYYHSILMWAWKTRIHLYFWLNYFESFMQFIEILPKCLNFHIHF